MRASNVARRSVDELLGAGQLGLQLGQEGRVGGELVAGQTALLLPRTWREAADGARWAESGPVRRSD